MEIGSTTKGSGTCVMATTTPTRLRMSGSGAPIRPAAPRASFRRPLSWRTMDHAAVRTRSEVQSGSSTATSITARRQPRAEAAINA